MSTPIRTSAVAIIALLVSVAARAETVTVAVASNFAEPLREIAAKYTARGGAAIRISTGSSGHLYAQIVNGAPFDLFLSADARRPQLLEDDGLGVAETRATYALGTLILWVRAGHSTGSSCDAALANPGKTRIAIANPVLAPYGAAAKEVLYGRGVWESLQSNLVYGENISQVLHFVATGNVDLALLSASQLPALDDIPAQCTSSFLATDHEPIAQQVILLRRSSDNQSARAFLDYLRGPDAREIIARYAYRLPPETDEDAS